MDKAVVKLSLKSLALGVLVGALAFYSSRAFTQAPAPGVIAAQQPDSPLLIVPTFVDASDPLRPRYGYSVTNATETSIRAYAIKQSVSLGTGGSLIGTTLTHSPAARRFLMPHASRQEEGGIGRMYKSPPVRVELAVDFVEFADGKRWGVDEGNSGEKLDGIRAGGRTAIKKYREILAEKGVGTLDQAIDTTSLPLPEGAPASDAWAEGFKIGVNTVRSRLSEARSKKGRDGVVMELSRPFDSTEGRQDP